MPCQQLTTFKSEYAKLIQVLSLSDTKKTISLASKLAKLTIQMVDEKPIYLTGLVIILSSPAHYQSGYQPFLRSVMLIIIAHQNRLNARASLSVLTGFLLSSAVQEIPSDNRKQTMLKMMTVLNKLNLTNARDILSISKLLSSDSLLRYLPFCRLHYWQWFAVWSVCLTHSGFLKLSWSRRLIALFHACPGWSHDYLLPLLNYPSLCPPSAVINVDEKIYVVLRTLENTVFYLDKEGQEHAVSSQDFTLTHHHAEPENWLSICEQSDLPSPFPECFPITKPPGSLTNVLSMLSNEQVEIEPLAHAIENEPSFSRFVMQTASDGNRLSLPVVTVKQGIMTHGIEKLGDMLIAHAMINRFKQSDFPARSSTLDFVTIQMIMAAELAAKSTCLLPQTASLISLVASSALFTHPSLKTISKWQIADSESVGQNVDKLIPNIQSGTFTKSAMTLASAWKLSKRHTVLLTQLCAPMDQAANLKASAVVLRLALVWTSQCSIGRDFTSTPSSVEKPLMAKLGLNQKDKQVIHDAISGQLICTLSKH